MMPANSRSIRRIVVYSAMVNQFQFFIKQKTFRCSVCTKSICNFIVLINHIVPVIFLLFGISFHFIITVIIGTLCFIAVQNNNADIHFLCIIADRNGTLLVLYNIRACIATEHYQNTFVFHGIFHAYFFARYIFHFNPGFRHCASNRQYIGSSKCCCYCNGTCS